MTANAVVHRFRARARRRGLPLRVRRIIAAADRIAGLPYRYGGGHGNWHDSGYDGSGSVSFALHGAGLLRIALDSGRLMGWGAPGSGRWVTVYAKPSHAYMVVAGRRFDTSRLRRDALAGRSAHRRRLRRPPPAGAVAGAAADQRPQQRLYFSPEPHGQGSLRAGCEATPLPDRASRTASRSRSQLGGVEQDLGVAGVVASSR